MHGVGPLDAILLDRPSLEQAVDVGLGLDEIKRLDLGGNIFNSQLHRSAPNRTEKGSRSENYGTSPGGFKYGGRLAMVAMRSGVLVQARAYSGPHLATILALLPAAWRKGGA